MWEMPALMLLVQIGSCQGLGGNLRKLPAFSLPDFFTVEV